jgi:hypothetical protein
MKIQGETMIKRMTVLALMALPLLVAGCAQHCSDCSRLCSEERIALTDTVETNTLKVLKTPGGAVETLRLEKAVVEHEGTEKEKMCLCQAVCFRVAQLAAQAWEDGVFRTYEVERIRTGWNTGGPWEFFSDKEMHGEIGDLEMPAKKIVVAKRDGSAANPPDRLAIEDNWYEVTFANGSVLFLQVKDGGAGFFPEGFLAVRNQWKGGGKDSGDKKMQAAFKQKYNEAIGRIRAVPFRGIRVSKAGMDS